MSRFDFLPWDAIALEKHDAAKHYVKLLETCLDMLPDGRSKSLAVTHLEECFMWVGKAVRDDLIARKGTTELDLE